MSKTGNRASRGDERVTLRPKISPKVANNRANLRLDKHGLEEIDSHTLTHVHVPRSLPSTERCNDSNKYFPSNTALGKFDEEMFISDRRARGNEVKTHPVHSSMALGPNYTEIGVAPSETGVLLILAPLDVSRGMVLARQLLDHPATFLVASKPLVCVRPYNNTL